MTPIVHITPKEQALQRENESLLQALRISSFTVETQAEQIDKLKAACDKFSESEMLLKAQPVQPALTDAELPELPRPDRNAWPHGFHDLFTAQQMRDYTQQATAPILAKLATQVALVEKCMVAMNENADRGEKAEAEVGRLVRKLALEREEFKAELDRIKAQPVQPAPLTDVCNHSNIIKADCIAWCGSCGVITWASDAIERVPGADAIARQKWCDENVVAWGCTNEASGRKCCKRWCQQRYCPVSLRADSGTGVQYD